MRKAQQRTITCSVERAGVRVRCLLDGGLCVVLCVCVCVSYRLVARVFLSVRLLMELCVWCGVALSSQRGRAVYDSCGGAEGRVRVVRESDVLTQVLNVKTQASVRCPAGHD